MSWLLNFLFLSLAINLVMFVPAFVLKTDKLTDISYSATFIVLAFVGLSKSAATGAQIVYFMCVILWASRLGSFLLMRIWNMKRDKRFDDMRDNFFAFLRFWLLQGVSVFVIMLSGLLLWRGGTGNLSILSYAGIVIFLTGFFMESTADVQKYRFNQIPKNKGKWIDTGLWGKSRHPNYLGEMMVWSGLYFLCAPLLSGWSILLAAISPIYIIILLMFVSGVPLLEKSADKRWGKNPDYKKYKNETPTLIPKLF